MRNIGANEQHKLVKKSGGLSQKGESSKSKKSPAGYAVDPVTGQCWCLARSAVVAQFMKLKATEPVLQRALRACFLLPRFAADAVKKER
jgi:hypothetical protein